jgi:hypothetical protein
VATGHVQQQPQSSFFCCCVVCRSSFIQKPLWSNPPATHTPATPISTATLLFPRFPLRLLWKLVAYPPQHGRPLTQLPRGLPPRQRQPGAPHQSF